MDDAMLQSATCCYYCGGTDLRPALSEVYDHFGMSRRPWSFCACGTCGSYILSPHPDAEGLADYYPPHYTHSPPSSLRWVEQLKYAVYYRLVHRAQAKVILNYLGVRQAQGRTLLDIGCGNGFLLKECRALGFAVTGVDMRAEAAEHIQKEMGIAVVQSPAETITDHFAPESFDVITAFHLVEHMVDPLAALSSWRSLLKPGGVLVLGVPVVKSLQALLLGKQWSAFSEAPRHVSVPSRRGMKVFLAEGRFEQIAIQGDSVLMNASSVSWSIFPRMLNTASTLMKAVWLATSYFFWPLALMEKWLGRSGICIACARKGHR